MSSLIVEVCEVKEVINHPNADRLDIVTVKGWNCIVGRDQFKVGDLVIYIPPDCILPQDMIEKNKLEYLKKSGRTGTIKLRGYISQGLCLPVYDTQRAKKMMGQDVSSHFGITKYEQPEPAYSVRGGNIVSKKKINPLFDKYTDVENIKNYPNVFKDGEIVVITEKLHGTNARFGNIPIVVSSSASLLERLSAWFRKSLLGRTHEFVWGSHNVQKGVSINRMDYYGSDVWSKAASDYQLENKLPAGYIFYGEIIGQGIQDMSYGIGKPQLYIFDIKDVASGKYLDWDKVESWCAFLDLPIVPVLWVGEFYGDSIEQFTSGKSTLCPGEIREGCVIKSFEEAQDKALGRKILKSISTEYLLRKNGTEFK